MCNREVAHQREVRMIMSIPDASQDRIEREIQIDAPPIERVFRLVSEPGWFIGDGEPGKTTTTREATSSSWTFPPRTGASRYFPSSPTHRTTSRSVGGETIPRSRSWRHVHPGRVLPVGAGRRHAPPRRRDRIRRPVPECRAPRGRLRRQYRGLGNATGVRQASRRTRRIEHLSCRPR